MTRALGRAVYWVDEAAIYGLVWLTMVGASIIVSERSGVSVTLLTDLLRGRAAVVVAKAIDALVLSCSVALLWFSWSWYDPPGMAAAGFDREAFQAGTFNFIYSEPTTTLGVAKFWVWLVMPMTAATMTVHSLGHLVARPAPPGEGEGAP